MESKKISLGEKVSYSDQYTTKDLFAINREERRKGYVKMYGEDVWTAFEFSFLLPNGLPQFHVIRIHNPVDSVNIFESKGLKLYLNSFNNTVFENLEKAIETVERDLSEFVRGDVKVESMKRFCEDHVDFYKNLDTLPLRSVVDSYDYNKNLLKVRDVPGRGAFYSNLLRSNCEITFQPDWARVSISYTADKQIDEESLLRYIISYRKHNEFHEPTCERIYQDLYRLLDPSFLLVVCQYTRRGGIDINPIRCSEPVKIELSKLIQQ